MSETLFKLTRSGHVPRETYGQAHIQWMASAQASDAKELMFGVTSIDVGGASPMHRHPNCEEVLHMLDGEIDQIVEGGHRFRMIPGDTVTIRRDAKHCAINAGAKPAVMIVVFSSPQRQTILVDD